MISPKKLVKLARKWRKTATMGRKRISLPGANPEVDLGSFNKSSVAEKGHFVIYTTDQRRYVLPLMYLNNAIFLELLKLGEEEFGLSSDGPITLPCDAVFMDFLVSFIQRGVEPNGEQKALINSITTSHCSFPDSFHHEHTSQYSAVCGY
ncbi:Auxin-responsive protein [Melia azedarach]|uniref:Auxin-responsive protein n=1 Tax=Melia azedarach TaxID=155640 RepID=A0ACC1XYY6_MELAZ|nr:Auxin-responsive protein [Melia azedarach]